MAQVIKFSAARLQNAGKRGELKPDAEGYYDLVIGGLNSYNSAGEFYTLEGAKELFEKSSSFMRRVANGCLKGEVGHPKKATGMSMNEYVNRILTIDEGNICCHFKEIWLDMDYGKRTNNQRSPNLVAIMAKVKPAGPKAASLEASLQNNSENVCFSIRALTKDYFVRGQCYRVLTNIVTFDNVVEPGIAIANKWDSPGLESLVNETVTLNQLRRVANDDQHRLVATESAQIAREVVAQLERSEQLAAPLYLNW